MGDGLNRSTMRGAGWRGGSHTPAGMGSTPSPATTMPKIGELVDHVTRVDEIGSVLPQRARVLALTAAGNLKLVMIGGKLHGRITIAPRADVELLEPRSF